MPRLFFVGVPSMLDSLADRQGNRIKVGQYCQAAARVYVGEVHRSEIETFLRQRAQMFSFEVHPRADGLRPDADQRTRQAGRGRALAVFTGRHGAFSHALLAPRMQASLARAGAICL